MLATFALACLVAAAVVAALVIANSTSTTALHLRHTFSSDWHTAVNQVRSLIGENTQK
jgi:TRAP-type C4-dicarboxylate transport system substrate-binding protein